MSLLQFYAIQYADKAAPLLRAHLPEIRALDAASAGEFPLALTLRRTAATLENCGQPDEALVLYQRSMEVTAGEDTDTRNAARNAIARLQPQSRSHKWKFWI